MSHPLRVLELFCGIGGCAAAIGDRAEIVAAVDQNLVALDVYRHNFSHPTLSQTVESIAVDRWCDWKADLWWLSPPCQPYTQRGRQRDLEDPRAASFLVVLDRIRELTPRYVALENVPAFDGSLAHQRLQATLREGGYEFQEWKICPSEWGLPNRRSRFYLVAGRNGLFPRPDLRPAPFKMGDILDADPDPSLWLEPQLHARYGSSLRLVTKDDSLSIAGCFTSAYGRSPIGAGSYLRTERGVRRFSPTEILRFLGFPGSYSFPPNLTHRQAWPLVGNSLSVPVVRSVLATVPEFALPPYPEG